MHFTKCSPKMRREYKCIWRIRRKHSGQKNLASIKKHKIKHISANFQPKPKEIVDLTVVSFLLIGANEHISLPATRTEIILCKIENTGYNTNPIEGTAKRQDRQGRVASRYNVQPCHLHHNTKKNFDAQRGEEGERRININSEIF